MIGKTVSHYRIVEKLGEGGMGVVYKARDAKLGREVALKFLPEAVIDDLDRLARFEREGRLLASLNHPNIGAIYGLEQSGTQPVLVLELVPGATLGQRLAASPMDTKEALCTAAQIARALEAAHDKGIIHRDLKPANVKLTPDGTVKVLDFGLGKASDEAASSTDTSHSPTKTIEQTRGGVILGTAHYMSPEQARGKGVDRRSDIWSFGCVLYEMLAGKRAFAGESIPDILAMILRAEPDWSLLPVDTPPAIGTLLRRCLQKDPNRRLQHIADARVEIEEASSELALPPAQARALSSQPRSLAWVVAGLLVVTTAVALWAPWRKNLPVAAQVVRFALHLPAEDPIFVWHAFPNLAISADGARLVYASDRGTSTRLLLRSMDRPDFRPLPGTEGGQSPFFSPDGNWIGFFADRKLKKVPVNGGAVVALWEASGSGGGFGAAAWDTDESIVFIAGFDSDMLRVPAAGGTPRPILTPDPARQIYTYLWPHLLPNQAGLLVTVNPGSIGSFDEARLAFLPKGGNSVIPVLTGGTCGKVLPTGHLVYSHRQTLMAIPFRADRETASGGGTPVVERVITLFISGGAQYAFSASGTLVYAAGDPPEVMSSLVSVDRRGRAETLLKTPQIIMDPSLSPDGRLLAIKSAKANDDIHLYDLKRGTLTRFTFEGGDKIGPVWTPDGARLAYSARRGNVSNIYWKPLDSAGAPELILPSENRQIPYSFSPDGKLLAYVEFDPSTGQDIRVVNVQGERKAQPFLRTSFEETTPQFSPDGRWLAFASNESGEYKIYVARYPDGGSKRPVSSGTGRDPRWNSTGLELFYWDEGNLMAVRIATQPSLEADQPRKLFDGVESDVLFPYRYVPTRDGERFLVTRHVRPEPVRQINVVLNWFEELKRLVPTK